MYREALLRAANARLHPSLRNPNYLVLRSRRHIVASYFANLPKGLVVLDVGGRYHPYRSLIAAKCTKYLALDVERTEVVTVVGSGESIPFPDETFDLVIATCVFEYFREPHKAANEVHRVLKPGGSVLASFGSVIPQFVEEERWRYLPLGLRSLFSAFSRVNIVPEVSSLGGFCRLMNLAFQDIAGFQALRVAYGWTLCPVLNLLGLALERTHLSSSTRWTGNYTLTAIK